MARRDRVVVASSNGWLVCLRAEDGGEVWRRFIGGESVATPIIADRSVVAYTIDGTLRVHSLLDGSERWTLEQNLPPLTLRGSAPPVVAGTTVIAGFDNGRVVATGLHDGQTRCEVVLMSGLPGSGKSRHRAAHFADWPVVSLDGLRAELDVDPDDDQGRVVQAAKERAREHLRAGRSFVWDATALSRRFRTPLLSFFAGYAARLRIVYVEAPASRLFAQNASRAAVVPEAAIRAMLERWEVPDATEAHAVEHHTD